MILLKQKYIIEQQLLLGDKLKYLTVSYARKNAKIMHNFCLLLLLAFIFRCDPSY